MRQLEAISLTLNLVCDQCHQGIHVAGLVERVVCPHCAAHAKTDWAGFSSIVLEGLLKRPGRSQSYKFMARNGSGNIDARHGLPRCGECDGSIPLDAMGGGRDLVCVEGHRVAVREATELATHLMPGALWIVGEGATAEAEEQKEQAPILLNCKACAGDLRLDGDTDRDLTCPYCSSLNVIPDALWIRLHPELQPRTFGIIAAWGDDEQLAFRLSCRLVALKRSGNRKPLIEREHELTENWPTPPGDALCWAANGRSGDERSRLATFGDLPPKLVQILAEDRATGVRIAVAGRPDLSEALQAQLAGDRKTGVLLALLERRELAAAAAEILATSKQDRLLDGLVKRDDLSTSTRLQLARSGRPKPLQSLTAAEVAVQDLAGLAEATDLVEARRLVAEHPQAPSNLLEELAADPEIAIRHVVAAHPALPPAAIETLISAEDPSILHTLAHRTGAPADLLKRLASLGGDLHRTVLRRPDCPPTLVDEAARSDDPALHRIVARHEAADEATLVVLAARTQDPETVSALLGQPRTDALDRALATAASARLRLAAVRRGPPSDALPDLAADSDVEVRRAISKMDDLPAELAIVLSRDADEAVQASLEGHPALVRRRRLRMAAFAAVATVLIVCAGGVGTVLLGLGWAATL